MAAFLVDELGAKAAAKKALSNADWYEEGRSERQYWYRVAEAVTPPWRTLIPRSPFRHDVRAPAPRPAPLFEEPRRCPSTPRVD